MNTFKGHSFKTPAQAARAAELWEMQKEGKITDLTFHPTIKLTEAGLSYPLTFSYWEGNYIVYEAFKGLVNPRHKDLVKLWPEYAKSWTILRVTRSKRGQTVVVKEIRKAQ